MHEICDILIQIRPLSGLNVKEKQNTKALQLDHKFRLIE
jgi:hypothetical protein